MSNFRSVRGPGENSTGRYLRGEREYSTLTLVGVSMSSGPDPARRRLLRRSALPPSRPLTGVVCMSIPSNSSRLWVTSPDISSPSLAWGVVSGWDIVEFCLLPPGDSTCWRRSRDSGPPLDARSPPDFTSILVSWPGGAGRVEAPSGAFCWSLFGVAYDAAGNGSRN